MYKIYKDSKEIATIEKLIYVKKHPTNDSYIPADESDATGVSLPGAAYALMGKDLHGLKHVVVIEADGGIDIDNANTINDLLIEYALNTEYRMILMEMGV